MISEQWIESLTRRLLDKNLEYRFLRDQLEKVIKENISGEYLIHIEPAHPDEVLVYITESGSMGQKLVFKSHELIKLINETEHQLSIEDVKQFLAVT